jgi:hypothetical protein
MTWTERETLLLIDNDRLGLLLVHLLLLHLLLLVPRLVLLDVGLSRRSCPCREWLRLSLCIDDDGRSLGCLGDGSNGGRHDALFSVGGDVALGFWCWGDLLLEGVAARSDDVDDGRGGLRVRVGVVVGDRRRLGIVIRLVDVEVVAIGRSGVSICTTRRRI